MTSIKVKFRSSSVTGKEGTIYYQIIKDRIVRQLKTKHRLFEEEWNPRTSDIIIAGERAGRLKDLQWSITCDENILRQIIANWERAGKSFSAGDVVDEFVHNAKEYSFFGFMDNVISRMGQQRRFRSCETYAATLKSFMRFRVGKDVMLRAVDSDMMVSYEAYLKRNDVTMNSISFYMRILRAVYNRAVEDGIVEQSYPFRRVYTGVDKTVKRAISVKYMKRIKELDLTRRKSLGLFRDIFMFSFYTRGMSFVDIAYLRKSDLQNGVLAYRRKKTGQQLMIRWEQCMQDIVDKYDMPDGNPYMLPIIKHPGQDERKQYKNALFQINRRLKDIACMVNLNAPLTMYVARHTWASVAKSRNIPISIISEGMGHDSEFTTQIYLTSLDSNVVDRANRQILNLL